jgi:hypothetical protein
MEEKNNYNNYDNILKNEKLFYVLKDKSVSSL